MMHDEPRLAQGYLCQLTRASDGCLFGRAGTQEVMSRNLQLCR